MSGALGLEGSALDYAQPVYLTQLLGVANADIVAALTAVAALRPLLSARIEAVLGEPEEIPEAEQAILSRVVNADLETLLQAARIVSVLVHAPSLGLTADGTVLRLAVAHAGTKAVASRMRDADGPTLAALPHTEALTQEILDLYAKDALRRLLGLIPPALFQRFLLQFPAEALPAPVSLADEAAQRPNVLRLAEIAFATIDEVRAETVEQGTDATA